MLRKIKILTFLLATGTSLFGERSIQTLIDSGEIKECFLNNGTLQLTHKNLDSIRGIESIPLAESITTIDLSFNKIKKIDEINLSSFPYLEQLWLNNNQIKDLSPLNNLNALHSLKTLNLASNQIGAISENAFNKLSQLKVLILNHNNLYELPQIEVLINLRELHVTHNFLEKLNLEKLKNIRYLYILNAGFNKIKEINPLLNVQLKNLEVLYLNNNSLTQIPAFAFEAFPKLLMLYLQNNQIELLNQDSFKTLKHLRLLYLYNNLITTLPQNVFSDLLSIQILFLNNNPVYEGLSNTSAQTEELQTETQYNCITNTANGEEPQNIMPEKVTPGIQSFLETCRNTVYQDIFVNGSIIKEGVKDCAIRFPIIKNILDQYKRPFTVLDIGASEGYFSLRIATHYPESTCVMIEGDKSLRLPQICSLNSNLNNVVVLEKFITPQDLKELADCEHFDLVLAFNVIHQMKGAWKQSIDYLLSLGDNILIETPPPGCHTSANAHLLPLIEEYLEKHKQGQVVAQVPRYGRPGLATPDQKYSNVYHFKMNKNVLAKPTWKSPNLRFYPVISNFHEKFLYKPRINKILPWQRGINLWTFKHMNGSYPQKPVIHSEIERLATYFHTDFLPWNMIIQGKNLELIDWEDNNAPLYAHNATACIADYESRKFME